ncbi:MAG: DUF3307 domain-containing protein [Pseudomonadota bacterium]
MRGRDLGESAGALLILLSLLQVKHMFADFFWQNEFMLGDRDKYIHPGRMVHAGIHAVASFIAFVIMGASFAFVLVLVLAEWVVHYHIDFWKGRYTAKNDLTPADASFWRATGVDQALHQFTYIAMILAWFATLPT